MGLFFDDPWEMYRSNRAIEEENREFSEIAVKIAIIVVAFLVSLSISLVNY